jgi:hypothetical protein
MNNVNLERVMGLIIPVIDLVGQSIFMMAGLVGVCMVSGLHDSSLFILLYAQMLLGPWQMLSGLISILIKSTGYRQKRIHFVVSIIYLAVLGLGIWSGEQGYLPLNRNLLETLAMLGLTIPAWILGTYYYVLTWRTVFPGYKKTSSFLPHINF